LDQSPQYIIISDKIANMIQLYIGDNLIFSINEVKFNTSVLAITTELPGLNLTTQNDIIISHIALPVNAGNYFIRLEDDYTKGEKNLSKITLLKSQILNQSANKISAIQINPKYTFVKESEAICSLFEFMSLILFIFFAIITFQMNQQNYASLEKEQEILMKEGFSEKKIRYWSHFDFIYLLIWIIINAIVWGLLLGAFLYRLFCFPSIFGDTGIISILFPKISIHALEKLSVNSDPFIISIPYQISFDPWVIFGIIGVVLLLFIILQLSLSRFNTKKKVEKKLV
jgi:hypothetical protein